MTRRERRFMVGGAGLVLVVFAARTGPGALGALADWQQRVRARAALVARQEAELAQLAVLEGRADSLKARVEALADALLPGRTEAEAEAELLTRVQATAAGASGTLQLAEAVPDSLRIGWLRRVRVRATWSSDFSGLLAFMHRLEYGRPLLVVNRIRVESAAADPSGAVPEQLTAELVLEGWYLSREAE